MSEVTTVALAPTPHGPLPFGTFARTKKNRLIFWPVLARDARLCDIDGRPLTVDHLTLEFPSGKTHATSIDREGRHLPHRNAWRLHEFRNTGLALWFMFFVPWSVLRNQDLVVEQRAYFPTTDASRRENEFREFAKRFSGATVPLAPTGVKGDFVWCLCYVSTDERTDHQLTSDLVPCGPYLDAWIDGFPAGTQIDVFGACIQVENSRLLLATICPPGQLKDGEVTFGLPQSPHYTPKDKPKEVQRSRQIYRPE